MVADFDPSVETSKMLPMLPPGSGRMEKRRKTIIAKICYIMASLSCASILFAVVLLMTNGSIRHAVFVADFRGGFPWRISSGGFCGRFPWRILRRISVADFRGGFCADLPADLSKSCGGFWRRICSDFFRGGFLRRICSGPKPFNYTSKSHRKSTTKIHRILHRVLL